MPNATTKTGPVAGQPYAALVLTGSFDVQRFNFAAPADALICAIRYMREGKQVRLTDRTCAALRESGPMEAFDALLTAMGVPNGRPVADVPFRAEVHHA